MRGRAAPQSAGPLLRLGVLQVMSRSLAGSIKGMLSHADKAFGGSRGNASGSGGCAGCLLAVALMVGVAVIVQYWVPIVLALGGIAAVVIVATAAVRLARGRPAKVQNDSPLNQDTDIASPAGWYPDPSGHHDHRYWDGFSWSDTVADAGEVSSDVL